MLLLRRLRLPLPLTSACCRCRQLHDLFGASQHVLGQASFEPGASLLSALPPVSAGRPVPPLPSTSGFATSMLMSPGRMSAASKSLQMDLHFGAAHNSQSQSWLLLPSPSPLPLRWPLLLLLLLLFPLPLLLALHSW